MGNIFFKDNLRSLINCAKEQNVVFIYALSPGLDMVFSSSKEVDILKNKIKQVCDHYLATSCMVSQLSSRHVYIHYIPRLY